MNISSPRRPRVSPTSPSGSSSASPGSRCPVPGGAAVVGTDPAQRQPPSSVRVNQPGAEVAAR